MRNDTAIVRAETGIPGLNDILAGGFIPYRLYLLEGTPGSGKTTLAFQFLLEGVRRGERVLYITLSETAEEIGDVAHSHGWTLDGVSIYELVPSEKILEASEHYSVFHPSEVELSETTSRILEEFERVSPSRVVFDSLSELRLLSGSPLRYRRQILALKQFFAGRQCTVLLLDDLTAAQHDLQVQSIAHGALLLEQSIPAFGVARRRLSVTKYRGSDFRGGYHDYTIRRGGLEVYPRLVAAEHRQHGGRRRAKSGVAALDALLGGGLERSTSTLIQGAPGTGKSTLAALIATHEAALGERSTLFLFDERPDTLYARTEGLDIPLRKYVDSGHIVVRPVDPAELTPGAFGQAIRLAVERSESKLIVIDSLNGYLLSMPDEKFLVVQLHELLSFLGHRGVATILIAAQQSLISRESSAPVEVSYLADSVVQLRYFESEGDVRQVISVLKMRSSAHDHTIREFKLQPGGVSIGEPLRDYHGVFTGIPDRQTSA